MKGLKKWIMRICGGAMLATLIGGVFAFNTDVAQAEEENYFVQGASVRLVDDTHVSAIKFYVLMTLDEFDTYGTVEGDTLTLDRGYTTGTLVSPYRLLNGGELTVEAIENIDGQAYCRDTTDDWERVNIDGVDYAQSFIRFFNLREDAYGSELAVRGVIKKDGEPIRYTAQENNISPS